MPFFQPVPIEEFILKLLRSDRQVGIIIEQWTLDRDDIASVLVAHFREVGVGLVHPLLHAEMVRKHIYFQLVHSPELQAKIAKLEEDLRRTKARQNRYRGP